MNNEAHVLSAIRRHVWAGTYDAEEIAIIVGEEFFPPGQADYDWLRARIEEAFRPKRAEEATWPAVTDCDRLDQVFETLQKQGIIVEQDAGLTKSDGLEIVTEAYEDAQADGEGEGIVGYCFYHGQDLQRVMKSGDLWLAFGHFAGKRGWALTSASASSTRWRQRASRWNGTGRLERGCSSRAFDGSGAARRPNQALQQTAGA